MDFTDQLQKLGFAKVRVEIDASKPLKLGIHIKDGIRNFWQAIIYENITNFCFICGWISHKDDSYKFP